jgi:hypothetical protein
VIRFGKYGRKESWIMKKIWKIQKKIVNRYGNYGRKVSWIVKRYGNYGRKVSWIVKRFGKYRRKYLKDRENMEER